MKLKKEWLIIVLLPLSILLLDFIFARIHWYAAIESLDEGMHFSGGIALGIVYVLLVRLCQEKRIMGEMHPLVFYISVVSLIALTAVTWELYEFSLDILLPQEALRQPSVQDTMGDLFLGLLGGTIGFVFMKRYWKGK